MNRDFLMMPPAASLSRAGLIVATALLGACSGGGGSVPNLQSARPAAAFDHASLAPTESSGASSSSDASFLSATTTASSAPVAIVPSRHPKFTTMPAFSAGTFVRSIGINMHNSYYGTAYTANVPLVESLVEGLGVSTVRDVMDVGNANVCAEDRAIANSGLRFDFIVQVGQSSSNIGSWVSCVGAQNVASLEGPNEYNVSHPASDTNWVQSLERQQQLIYSTVKANYPGMAVIAPSITTAAAVADVGSLAPTLDEGNIHIYFDGYNPETTGYGPNGSGPDGYGSLGYFAAMADTISQSKPIAVTESGYGTAGGATQVSEMTQAKYVPRLLLDFAKNGVAQSMIYELIDEGGPPYARYGLVRSDFSTKPAYNAEKSLLALLRDSGTSSGSLEVAIAGQTANVDTMLFRKSDGSYALAVWLAVLSCNPSTGADVVPPAQSVTISFSRPIRVPKRYVYNSNFVFSPTSLAPGTSETLTVSDEVQILTFK